MKDHFLKREISENLIERRCLLMPKLGRLMFLRRRETSCLYRMLQNGYRTLCDRVRGHSILGSKTRVFKRLCKTDPHPISSRYCLHANRTVAVQGTRRRGVWDQGVLWRSSRGIPRRSSTNSICKEFFGRTVLLQEVLSYRVSSLALWSSSSHAFR